MRRTNVGQQNSPPGRKILDAIQNDTDYAILHKSYGADPRTGEVRYSPAICTGCDKETTIGKPDMMILFNKPASGQAR